jgi:hypothetical protein
MMERSGRDRVVLFSTEGLISVDIGLLRAVGGELSERLGSPVEVWESVEGEFVEVEAFGVRDGVESDQIRCDDRWVLVPCGFMPGGYERIVGEDYGEWVWDFSGLRAALWFSRIGKGRNGSGVNPDVYIADPLTAWDVGKWLGDLSEVGGEPRGIVVGTSMRVEDIERIVIVVFWANRKVEDGWRMVINGEGDSGRRKTESRGLRLVDLPWVLSSAEVPEEEFANWAMQRVLQGLRARPMSWEVSEDESWKILNRLHDRMGEELPGEYMGKLDGVSPRSMGSVAIVPDETGKVPWDKLWTSFCDLAMAGGPPHRGKLLEPVVREEIVADMGAYREVEAEIRRGIGLASGLKTLESPYLGWLAVECESEEMAAWLLRAILVENISVRREGRLLYLPAGPRFRVEKEIKNVITAVAKTVHYWQAHLRSRQPPKPL